MRTSTNVIFDFEAFLKKHFGLTTELHSELGKNIDNWGNDAYDLKELFTEEAWEAWERAIALFEDMAEIGLIRERDRDDILESFCDNA